MAIHRSAGGVDAIRRAHTYLQQALYHVESTYAAVGLESLLLPSDSKEVMDTLERLQVKPVAPSKRY